MSKKVLYGILSGALALSVLAACGETTDEPAPADAPELEEDLGEDLGEEEDAE